MESRPWGCAFRCFLLGVGITGIVGCFGKSSWVTGHADQCLVRRAGITGGLSLVSNQPSASLSYGMDRVPKGQWFGLSCLVVESHDTPGKTSATLTTST